MSLALAGVVDPVAAAPTAVTGSEQLTDWTAEARAMATAAARTAFGAQLPSRVEVAAGALDSRLRLAPCKRIEPFLPAGHRPWGRTRLGLRCVEGPVAWNVSVALTVRVFAPALVTSQALPAGTVIAPEHLRAAEVDWAERDSPVIVAEPAALGRVLATPLAAGAPLRQEHLKRRQWFDAGDPIRLVAVGKGFSVSGEGVALAAGLEGQPVRVRTESGRLVTGTAVGPRRVEIEL